jgi:hypothetical protein
MVSLVEAVVAIATQQHADRIDGLLTRGRHDKAEQRLSKAGWWRPERVEDVSTHAAAALRDSASGDVVWSLERSGWRELALDVAADRIVDGYFALFVTADGTVLFAPEGTARYRSLR